MFQITTFRVMLLLIAVFLLFIQPPCDLALAVTKDFLSFARQDTPEIHPTETPDLMGYKELVPTEELQATVETADARSDAEYCDAIKYIEVVADSNPEEKTNDNGSYYCVYNLTITNNHPSSKIVISWKHDISSDSRGPYWTHPRLEPGGTYPVTLRSDKDSDGKWKTIDANHLMAWFSSEACDRYKNDYWPTEAEPDKLLTSELTRIELSNPCMP